MKVLLLALLICGCSSSSRGGLSIGMDPTWYLAGFGSKTSYINGYTEDLLLEIARYSGMQFELVRAGSDNLLDGMRAGKYDAVLTTLPPYEYNLAKYDFSDNLLSLGPVLIVYHDAQQNSLEKMEGNLVGILTNDPAVFLLEKHPTIVIRQYNSIPELLDALSLGGIQ